MRSNAFKRTLVENGTTALTFMLHISKEERRERLQARLDEPEQHAARRGSRNKPRPTARRELARGQHQ